MIIEVTGVSTRNKGAQLMLIAIADHFRNVPGVELAVDRWFGTYADRARYGLLQKFVVSKWGRSRLSLALMPDSMKEGIGIIDEDDVDVILDASGFAFGDQHPPERTLEFARQVESAKRRGKRVILLPQALGPFKSERMRGGFRRVIDAADLIYARDDQSMQYVNDAFGTPENVRQAPDFTNLVAPKLSISSGDSQTVRIVPNVRMVEFASSAEDVERYKSILLESIDRSTAAGLDAELLVHGRQDHDLATEIADSSSHEVAVVLEDDPVELKRLLGECRFVVGSRFHAIVGALSQGVPVIGTSWSHKYGMLFEEYDIPDLLLGEKTVAADVACRVDRLTGPDCAEIVSRVESCAARQKTQAREMWNVVDSLLLN